MKRYLLFIPAALLVAFGLFTLMQALINAGELKVDTSKRGSLIDFVRVKREAAFDTKKRELPQKKAAANQPNAPEMKLNSNSGPTSGGPAIAVNVGGDSMALESGRHVRVSAGPMMSAAASDMDTVPMVRVDPQYPQAASQRGLTGYVYLMFTIAPDGTVRDAQVLEAQPPGVFETAALNAVRKWKYKPKIENGAPVERPGVKVNLKFDLPSSERR